MTEPRFVHLRVHTDYSLVDGVARVKELIKASVDQRMPAVAVTDENNLFALIKFYSGAMGAGLKPIMGADLWLQADDPEDEPHYLCCLVQNETGYLNLTLLISRAWQHNQHRDRAMIRREWLMELNEGLILLSGARVGDVGRLLLSGKTDAARQRAREYQDVFGDRFYLEVQRTERPGDEDCLHASVALAADLGCRWWPPTTCASCAARTSRPTRPASASTTATPWTTRAGRASTPRSST
ncbi:DNA polymerase III subunit alpha [Alcanivorax sp. ALC70]|nr:DNA polymerase III subunit alpha [Alcanivorax sp. ALC70]